MSDKRIKVFAYGSNMLTAWMRKRVPSANPIGIGRLNGHRLKWHKVSKDGSGKCDAEFTGTDSDIVWGVLYELNSAEKPTLDKVEGLGRGYSEKAVDILVDSKTVNAWLYIATNKDPSAVPYHWYKDLVVHGARRHQLPEDYVAVLEAIVSKSDPDAERAARNARILACD